MSQQMGQHDAGQAASKRVLTIPNLISFTRLALLPVFLVIYLKGHYLAATVLLVVVGTSDFLDGFLARALHQVSELGKLLDPLADRLVIIAALVAFGVKGTVPWWLAGVIVARDVAIMVAFAVLERRGLPRLPVNKTGKRATACLFSGFAGVAAGVVMKASGVAWVHGHASWLRGAGLVFLVAGAVLYYAAGGLYAIEIRRQLAARAGRPPTVT